MHSFIVSLAFCPGIYKQVMCFSLYITHPIQHNLVLNLLGQVNIYSVWFLLSVQTWVIDKLLQRSWTKAQLLYIKNVRSLSFPDLLIHTVFRAKD